MRRTAIFALCLTISSAIPANATRPDDRGRDLARAIAALAQETRSEILVDTSLLRGKRAAPEHDARTLEDRLAAILQGSGLTFRRSTSGAWMILKAPRAPVAATEQGPRPDPAVPEIFVVGRQTLNSDLRRSVDDIQPYQVLQADAIDEAQPDSVEDLVRTRLPEDGQALSFRQAARLNDGTVRSQIDLRGLGTDQTLVLINGRRMPSIPGDGFFGQADLNGLPTSGIDRIETLGSTASGIFGVGATGGAINVVTDHDFNRITLGLHSGLSARGDAARRGIDASAGLTSSNGRSRLLIRFSKSSDAGLAFGDRPFVQDARTIREANGFGSFTFPVSNSVNVTSLGGGILSLRPDLGGASIGASRTFLSSGGSVLDAAGIAQLIAHAGRLDYGLSSDGQGGKQSLLTPMRTESLLATLRQSIGDRLDTFVDIVHLRDRGDATIPALVTTNTILVAGAPGNPFGQDVTISFPTPGVVGSAITSTVTNRYMAGAIVRLGRGWTGNLDGAIGRATVRQRTDAAAPLSEIDPFLGRPALDAQLGALPRAETRSVAVNRFRDLNLRVAGPLWRLPGGPMSLTITGEARREHAPGAITETLEADMPHTSIQQRGQLEDVGSILAEARAPLGTTDSPAWLRELELQLAVRHDRYSLAVPVTSTLVETAGLYGPEVSNRATITALTAGFRITPIDGMTFRASIASGYTPPTAAQITPSATTVPIGSVRDPLRPAQKTLSPDEILVPIDGSPNLKPQRTQTISFGAIFKPHLAPGLRLSADFTELRTTREITDFADVDFQYFVDHEAQYPDRVRRLPLTTADAALGLTAGQIALIDTSFLAIGRSTVKTLDITIDYALPVASGKLQMHAAATWEPEFRRRGDPMATYWNLVDHLDGVDALRANAGVGWESDFWSTELDIQLYGRSGVVYATPRLTNGNAVLAAEQGSTHLPAQAYLDWSVGARTVRSPVGRAPGLDYRFSVKNLLDTKPPVVASPLVGGLDGIGYSPLADPRGRRFEIEVIAHY